MIRPLVSACLVLAVGGMVAGCSRPSESKASTRGPHPRDLAKRVAAVGKLTDQVVLARIAKGSEDRKVRLAAVKRLTSPTALADVARNADAPIVRRDAVKKLTDPDVLTNLANNENDPGVIAAAMNVLTDHQDRVADLTVHGRTEAVRERAASHLDDQALLTEIARGDDYRTVRAAAVGRLIDPELLANIARTDHSRIVRVAAIETLNRLDLLADLASIIETDEPRLWEGRMFDKRRAQTAANLHAKKSPHAAMQYASAETMAATRRGLAQTTFANLAKHEDDDLVCDAAAACLRDVAMLSDVAQNANLPRTRDRAARELIELRSREKQP